MAKIRRIIRKLDTPHDAALDEQQWPVNVALAVLGGFSLGTSLAYLRFDDPRWWANAWTYVILVPLIVVGAMAAFRYVSNKFFRRSMQLGLVASAIFHVAMVILSAESLIFTALMVDPKSRAPLPDQRLPDLTVQLTSDTFLPDESVPQDFERPVETETPDVDPDPLIKKEETQEETSPRAPQPVPIPEPQKTQQPAVVKRPTTEQAAPREASTLSRLSRNTQLKDVAPAQTMIGAERSAEQPSEAKATPALASVSRQATEHSVTARSPEREPSAVRPSEAVALAKKTAELSPTPDTTATATLKRQVNQPALTPKSQIDVADVPSVARRTSDTEPTPNNTASTRRVTTSPTAERASQEPTTEPTTQVAATGTRRELDSKPQPTIAAAPTSAASRQPRVTPRMAASVAEAPATPQAQSSSPLAPGPQSTSVARAAATGNSPRAGSTTAAAPEPVASAGSAASGEGSAVARAAATNSQPAPGATQGAPGTPRRATTDARLAGATTAEAGVALAGGTTGAGSAAPGPSRLALSRAQSGVAGAGNSPNLDRGSGAGDSPALAASVSARRVEATSSGLPDGAISPSSSAVRAHSRAAAASPTSNSRAETLAGAAEGGAPQTGEVIASASASLAQATGSAARGEVSAAKGTAEIDVGPTTIIAEGGRGRASGGGQPELSFDPRRGTGSGSPEVEGEGSGRPVARAASAGAPQLATSSAQVGDVPNAPVGDGGSRGAGDATPASTATARLAAAGAAASAGGPAIAGDEVPAGGGNVGATALARAEAATATPSPTTITGGGSGTPMKVAGGQAIAASAEAQTVQFAGAPASGGGPEGVNLQAQGIEAARISGGAASQIVEGAIGAAAGEEVVDAFGPQGAGNVAGGNRTVSPGLEDGPSITEMAAGSGPGRRSSETSFEAGETGKIEVPLVGPTSAVAQADLDHAVTGVGRTASDAGEGLVVNLDAPEGVGGLGSRIDSDVGLNTRLARADSLEIGPQPTRFVGRRSGGLPGVSIATAVPTDSYRKRAEGRAGRGRLPPQTEASIELGLQFLARVQQNDGSWRLQGLESSSRADPQMASDTAATALAVLAFQGAGYNHIEHKYAAVVRNGLDYLVQNQKDDGDLFVPLDDESNRSVWLYSHALAALSLCEAYGMTQDPALKDPAQRSIDFIVAAQHKERGGWRYSPGVGSDTSVTGAMLVAMRSAELAGLNVPNQAYDGVTTWLDSAQASPTQAHLYRYNPQAPDNDAQRHGRVASPTMTSLGLLMRLYLGWKRDNANMIQGADYLKEHLPALGTNTEPKRDTYYWYYATQVMFHMGGDHWKQWHDKLHKLLLDTQVKEGPYAGSWNPRLPVADRWGPHGGRLYVTALNLLSLEVQYRHLPTYEDTAK